MENLIQLQQGTKGYGGKILFGSCSFAVNESEHVGVIGPNGAGKTTLFKILVGQETLDSGTLIKSRGLRLGYLSQHDEWGQTETVEELIGRGTTLPIWELKSLGRGLGLNDEIYAKSLQSLSGGYRMRAKLLRLIGQEPNLMLLDEPTNYLDLETLLVLEKFLQGFRGAFLLISHDREFLRRTTDHVLEVEGGDIMKFNGTIDDYFDQKEMLRAQLAARAMSLEQKRKEIMDFVARFGAKASKASQAQSRLKSLDKMESIEIKSLPVSARIRVPAPARVGRIALTLKGVQLGYGERVVLSNVDLVLAGKDHLAVVGLNGAGKSTLLKALAGRLPLKAGTMEPGFETTFAFFNQHVAEALVAGDTVYRSLEKAAHPSVLPQDIKDLAGSLLFSGSDIQKPVSVLSGGEKSRVALGQVLLQKASCLILDEPTNHLDFQTVEALTQSLQAYAGALIVVSHDRGFVKRIATKILEVDRARVATYPGTYDDYVWSMERGAFATLKGATPAEGSLARAGEGTSGRPDGRTGVGSGNAIPGAMVSAAVDGATNKDRYEQKKAAEKRLRQVENGLKRIDAELSVLHTRQATLNEAIASGVATSFEHVGELGKNQEQIEKLEAQWMELAEEKEKLGGT